jgi:hypothetical protein
MQEDYKPEVCKMAESMQEVCKLVECLQEVYSCDHYTAIINVTLMSTGCPRTIIHKVALQLLQASK